MSRFTLDDHERQRLRTAAWRTLDTLERRRALTTVLATSIPDITQLLANNTDRNLQWAENTLSKLKEKRDPTPDLAQKPASETPADKDVLTHGSERMQFVNTLPMSEHGLIDRKRKWSWQVSELRKRPGQWALLREEKDRKRVKGYAYAVRTGRLTAFQPDGAFEARCITREGISGLYVRYVGEKK